MSSLIDSFKAVREELANRQVVTRRIPLHGDTPGSPIIHVTLKMLESNDLGRLTAAFERSAKKAPSKRTELAYDLQASIVATAFVKLRLTDQDDPESFDEFTDLSALGEMVDLPPGFKMADVIKHFCLRPGDVTALSDAVMDLSGFSNDESRAEVYEELEGK